MTGDQHVNAGLQMRISLYLHKFVKGVFRKKLLIVFFVNETDPATIFVIFFCTNGYSVLININI